MPLQVQIILTGSLVLVAGLVIAKKFDSMPLVWLTKPAASLGFVVLAVLSVQDCTLVNGLMISGFVLCLLGDVLLIPRSSIMFLGGLIAFLAGHVMYIAAFSRIANFDWLLLLPLLLLLLVNLLVYRWLQGYLEAMRLPVIAYMLVITCMVLSACGVYLNDLLPIIVRLLVLAGAVGFFLSDLFVVREQFVQKSFVNPLLGLPLYYASQLALAISLGYMQI